MEELIYQKMYELLELGSKEENLIIAYPSIFERHLFQIFAYNGTFINSEPQYIFGMKIYNQHPYNEIVIYDSKNVYRGDMFLRKIELEIIEKIFTPDKSCA